MRRGLTLVAATLLLSGNLASARTEALQEFVESGGCKLRGSATSVARQKEISSLGAVTWTGRCVNGLIDGPGRLRYQGVTQENGRVRRYMFDFTGVARAGLRVGSWRRESFNMYEGSARYWTSMATLNYVDGVAKGEVRLRDARSNEDFSPSFREFLAAVDRDLAASRGGAAQAPAERGPEAAGKPAATAAAATPPAVTVSPAPPPAPNAPQASAPASIAAPAPPTSATPAPAPPAPATPAAAPPAAATPAAAPAAAAPPVVAMRAPPASDVRTPPAASAPTAPSVSPTADQNNETPHAGVFPIIPPMAVLTAPGVVGSQATAPGVPEARGTLRLLAPAGTLLPAPAPPAQPKQLLLEQRGFCSIDQINQQAVGEEGIVVAVSQPLTVIGWAADPNQPRAGVAPTIPERAWVRFYDRAGGTGLLVEIQRNVERRDVARALGHPGYAKSGFRISVVPGKLRTGEYTVSVLQAIGKDLSVCSSIARLQLR